MIDYYLDKALFKETGETIYWETGKNHKDGVFTNFFRKKNDELILKVKEETNYYKYSKDTDLVLNKKAKDAIHTYINTPIISRN
ncbi:hypothetical protein [Apilactobacillus timberlakei]|uniref:hypothetical protein n=1 Tax=Apilactobacillus timberlakei TaxID=2008380 RepID=UPI001129B171|nr:hypothetical protein [Apilactobacillus timberlakei]TPR16765.1 hypothetical protein DYZ95_07225 [Apilactobacillus timberlakei]TPR21528.1 hypothetical protein DY083_05775 [Apilactobacillus timberlakei]